MCIMFCSIVFDLFFANDFLRKLNCFDTSSPTWSVGRFARHNYSKRFVYFPLFSCLCIHMYIYTNIALSTLFALWKVDLFPPRKLVDLGIGGRGGHPPTLLPWARTEGIWSITASEYACPYASVFFCLFSFCFCLPLVSIMVKGSSFAMCCSHDGWPLIVWATVC